MPTRYSNTAEVPMSLAVFLATDHYDHNSDEYTISATTLLKPVRQIVLPSRVPTEDALVSLPDMMSNRLGAAIHDGIERAWLTNHRRAMDALGIPAKVIDLVQVNPKPEELKPDGIPVYLEQRLTRQVGKWKVTGKFDIVFDGRVQDFKTASVWSYMNQVNSDKQSWQGSIYRWLDPKMIHENEMDIIHIFMDWRASMVAQDSNYPTQRFKKQTFTLHSIQETQAYIQTKLKEIEQYWDAPEETIPLCTDEELWRSKPVFKYYKNPAKTSRSTKNFDNKQDALIHMSADGNVGVVVEKPGQVTACKYCAAFAACSQKDRLIEAGELVL